MSIYEELGFVDRSEYLENLADDNQVPLNNVIALAELLGEDEDFDGLVSAVEDMS